MNGNCGGYEVSGKSLSALSQDAPSRTVLHAIRRPSARLKTAELGLWFLGFFSRVFYVSLRRNALPRNVSFMTSKYWYFRDTLAFCTSFNAADPIIYFYIIGWSLLTNQAEVRLRWPVPRWHTAFCCKRYTPLAHLSRAFRELLAVRSCETRGGAQGAQFPFGAVKNATAL